MTKEHFTQLFESMFPEHIENMKNSLQKLLSSGAIDLTNLENYNYKEPKKAFCAILQNECFQYRPLHTNNKKDLKDIENYKNMC